MSIRPYQQDALAAIANKYREGVTRQLVSMPTGTGKTVLFANLPQLRLASGKMLVLAHREELINQAVDKISHWNPTLKVSVEMAERRADPAADIVVASVPSLGREGKRAREFPWSDFSTCVVDEAHHCTADTYRRVIGLGRFDNDRKLLLGVTATPERGDGVGLETVFDEIVYDYSLIEAIKDGWLVDLRAQTVHAKTNLDAVKTTAGDFNIGQLADAINTPERNALAVAAWQEYADGRTTVAFCARIDHAQDLASTFRQHGVSAAAVWGDDPDRSQKLRQLRDGEIQVVTNCGVLTEGYDDWHISCILLARPTKSGLLYRQMVGRGTRLEPEIGNLREALESIPWAVNKRDCLIIDIVDVSRQHELCTASSLVGLAGLETNAEETLDDLVRRVERAAVEHTPLPQVVSESVELFSFAVEHEVEQFMRMTWLCTAPGRYCLALPDRRRVLVQRDQLGHWHVDAPFQVQPICKTIDEVADGPFTSKSKPVFKSIQEAIQVAEGSAMVDIVSRGQAHTLSLLNKDARWRREPATPKQIAALTKLYKGTQLPTNLTKDTAGRLIDQFFEKLKGGHYVQR
jgi:superfamily II DNA or RNA helicase